MNITKTFIILALLLLNSCNSSSNKGEAIQEDNTLQTTTIKGSTSLSKSTVCIDENQDSICNEDEPQTASDKEGIYTLNYDGELADDAIILSQGGYNLNLLEENSAKLALKASFLKNHQKTNLNTLSTLIANNIEEGLTHQEAKDKIATKYHLNVNFIEHNPLELIGDENNKNIFLTIRAIENRVLHSQTKTTAQIQQKVENGNVIIEEEDADKALLGFDIFSFNLDDFIQELSKQIFDSFVFTTAFIANSTSYITYVPCLLGLTSCQGYPEINTTAPTPDENDSISQELVTRSELIGVWYGSKVGYNSKMCLDIGYLDTINAYGEENSANYHAIIDTFDEENRLLKVRQIYLTTLGHKSYSVYKSATIKDKIYLSSDSFVKYDTVEACQAKAKQDIDNKN